MKKAIAYLFSLMVAGGVQADIQLENQAFKVITLTSENGAKTQQWQAPDKMLPGDIVGYQISFSNPDAEAAENIVIANPIPENTSYVVDSAKGMGTRITFSIDGGQNYAQPEQLFVEKDGEKVPASAADYSHVRWQLNQPLAAGATGSVQYQVLIK